MSRKLTEYNILFSCPGDAYTECYDAIKVAIEDFNKYAKPNLSINTNLSHWSTDCFPQSGGHPQTLLDLQIVDEADAAIAVFWTRFGTPTDEYDSGTEDEIERLMNDSKQVFLYFLDKPVPPSITDSDTYKEQRGKVLAFKKKYENNGIYFIVANETELKERFSQHLFLYFAKLVAEETGITTKGENSKLIVTAVDGSKEARVHHFNLATEVDLDGQKAAIITKIKFANEISVPQIKKEVAPVGSSKALLSSSAVSMLSDMKELSKTFNTSPFITSQKEATISEDNKKLIGDFCEHNDIKLTNKFWDLGGLIIQHSQMLSAFGNGKSLSGSNEAKEKYQLIKDIVIDILQYIDSKRFYTDWDEMGYSELIVRNEGTTYDEDIEVRLTVPHGSLQTPREFPVPLFVLEKINEEELLQDWLRPVVTVDIEEFDYSQSGFSAPNFTAPILPFQSRDYEEEYNSEMELYFGNIGDLCDWELFNQGEDDVIKITIRKLNQYRAMHFPARLFWKKPPERIAYSIKAKFTATVITGEIEIVQ